MQESLSTYGLIGDPVKHSLSPIMHNIAFQELQVEATYKLYPLKEEVLEVFFHDLKQASSPIFGLNVTVPYKEKVIPFLDTLSPFAQQILAVNTIVISKDRKLTGHNTDGPGFLAHMTELGFNPKGKRVSIIGAGGASRAVICVLSLIPNRPESIRLYDIDKERADGLLNDLRGRFDVSHVESVRSIDDLNIELTDLFINATPVGMKESDACLFEAELFHPDMLVYDLIYNPAETKLLKIAHQRGAQISNGLGMLFYQGVLAFQHWFEIQLDESIKQKMRAGLEDALYK